MHIIFKQIPCDININFQQDIQNINLKNKL